MVAVVKDDRIVGQPRLFKLLEPMADFDIHLGYFVVVLGPIVADFGRVGVVGRDVSLGRVVYKRVRTDS